MVYIEEKVFEEMLNELRGYAERHGMLLIVEESVVKVVKDVTDKVEECMFEAVWERRRDAEETCEKSCLVKYGEPTAWQKECVKTCLRCWEMTERAQCAGIVSDQLTEHFHAIETFLKLRGLWYHCYQYTIIDEKVFFVAEFKPPPDLRKKV